MTGGGGGTAAGPAPVVAGVDGSPGALAAVRVAAREAAVRGAPLELVMAVPLPEGRQHPDPAADELRAAVHGIAGLALEAAAGVATAAGAAHLTTRVVDGEPAAALARAAGPGGLLCVGTRGAGPLRDGVLEAVLEAVLGSTAGALAATAACPVLVVPGRSGTAVEGRAGVVAGLAGGPADGVVLAAAVAAAAARSAGVVAVHAWQGHGGRAETREAARRRAEAVVDDALAPWRTAAPAVPVRRAVVEGAPAAALEGLALTAELVVVGRGSRPGGHLGAVPRALLRGASCPVLVVPGSGCPDRPAPAAGAVSREG